MDRAALEQLIDKIQAELSSRPVTARAAIVGRTPAAFELVSHFISTGTQHQLLGIFAKGGVARADEPLTNPRSIEQLRAMEPTWVIIASDVDKESLIADAMPYLAPATRILIGGFRHFEFHDLIFDSERANSFAPSFANGYPNSLIHIYQCLKNAARLELTGVVAEFGMFKGGTTMLMSRFIEALKCDWPVYGFDTFDGFPAPRSPLDMYAHSDCVYLDLNTVQQFFKGRNVQIVPGDVVETAKFMADKEVVFAFIDTDNYTSASRILEVITDRVVIGGSVLFDHFTGQDRFLYTLGERIAAKRLLDDHRYFNLHDTGVFLRLR